MIRKLKPRVKRASGWSKARRIKRQNTPYCEGCGKRVRFFKKIRLQIHHKKPIHLFPELELVQSNLKTFCLKCHLEKGHLGNWKSWNPYVDELCKLTLILHRGKPYTRTYTELNYAVTKMMRKLYQELKFMRGK